MGHVNRVSRSDPVMLPVVFYRTAVGNEPVKEWLDKLPDMEREVILLDIQTVRRGWPVGMPLAKKVRDGLWEIRSSLDNRIARILFHILAAPQEKGKRIPKGHAVKQGVLLHGFIKKTQKIPEKDIKLAMRRIKEITR